MSEPDPYKLLGISEDTPFEEIQDAKSRLLEQYGDNERQAQLIEKAYDMILMQRFRMRKEGKIKVPEGIRYAENAIPARPVKNSTKVPKAWEKWVEVPTFKELGLPTAIFGGAWILTVGFSAFNATMPLALLAALYLLYKKNNRFGRSLAFVFGGWLIASVLAYYALPGELATSVGTGLIFFALWAVSSFIK
ncbi:MAG: CPP1-like family protein [Gloeobacterales cyanobacterium]